MLLILLIILLIVVLVHARIYVRETERAMPPAGSFRVIDGIKLHYVDAGPQDGPGAPVVLIHGVSSNLLDMKLALGDRLAQERRVIMIDRPGYGYSERPVGAVDMGRQARIIDALLAELGVEKPVIIAHSYGGALALRHTLAFPDRARALILLAPVSHRWPGGVDWHNHAATMPGIGPLFSHTVPALYGRLAGRKAVEGAFWPQAQPAGYYEQAGMALIFRPMAFRSTGEDLVGLYDEITKMEPHYGSIRQPVHMIAGTHDTTVLSTIHCFGLKAKLADTSLQFLDNTGHTIHHSCSGEVEKLLAAIDGDVDATR
ncbi:alpha/beta fold hydrolase [Aquisalinus flavus]|uniref:Alpha/beta hydrolase n=1 Tax=Aquisalinus flavus TaxID=1526572 RepID=A0A8J2Y6J0_9PROT|nr:alpha/beta hydrolase [Aquisalinus flavus]MBD0427786.1 alpha/beta hydrolase [Aquisalinus flavus]UNE47559.1 alpha/beta hydrolase [Aquisalinus flavus]GGD03819.1 alpha/beta hydrolase [Aquisalinus flavus]